MESENYNPQKIADLLESEVREERILGRIMLERLDKCEPVLDLLKVAQNSCLLWVWFYGQPVNFGDYRSYSTFYGDNRYKRAIFKQLKVLDSIPYSEMFIDKWDLHES